MARITQIPNRFYSGICWLLRQILYPYMIPMAEGLENVPASGPVIIAGNHTNILDGLLVGLVCPRSAHFLVARELVEHKIMGGFFRSMGAIAVDRSKSRGGPAYHQAIEALSSDQAVGIFPEGRVNYGGPMHPFRPGLAIMALRTGAPIIPVAIWGVQEMFQPNSKIVTPSRAIIIFGEPLYFDKIDHEHINQELIEAVLRLVRRKIETNLEKAKKRFEELKGKPKPYKIKRMFSRLIIWPLSAWLISRAPTTWVDEQRPESRPELLVESLPTIECFTREQLPEVIARDIHHPHFKQCTFCAQRALVLILAAQELVEQSGT